MERIEFKTFTKMSKNSIVDYQDLINYAQELGQKAIAITDYNSIQIFPKLAKYINNHQDFKIILGTTVDMLEHDFLIPITIIVKNQPGLKNLYQIISRLKTDNFQKYGQQVITKADLVELSEGLLYGLDVLKMQDIYDNQTDEQVGSDMMWYDFIEVKPLSKSKEYLKRMLKIAINNRKIVIGVGDVCYVKPQEKADYAILFPKLTSNQDNYLKLTNEMLEAFNFLNDKALVLDLVVNNPNKLASLIANIQLNSNKLYLPILKTSQSQLLDMVYSKAYAMYGQPLPKLIEKRLNEELYGKDSSNQTGIINLQYESIFLINQKLVVYSHSLGYPTCSRGNTASSLIAYFIGLTDINPLPPHYYCSHCKNTIFIAKDICGLDLPDKKCTICHKIMSKDGFNLPYNSLLGENIHKAPSISINYSPDIKNKLDKYLKVMFGEDKVYKPGVVGIKQTQDIQKTIANNCNAKKLKITISTKQRLVQKLEGTIKILGQHPGSVFIIPKEKSIYDFTPLAYACDDIRYNKVTYFDYHYLNKTLLKINILFHDSLTMLKELEDITGINNNHLNFNDPKTWDLIRNCNTDNILEFANDFQKAMIRQVQPTTFQELIDIVIKAHSNNEYTLAKAHASSYVILAYKLAWYKANYLQQFQKVSLKYNSK